MLNKLQQKAYDAIHKDKQKIVYLTGSPGTGKTYCVSKIIENIDCVITATSHQAKTVLAEMTRMNTHTIHSYLGYLLTEYNYKQVLVKRDNHTIEPTHLLVVDEVSMLPNKLLKRILELLKEDNAPFKQVLFVGDAVQLPAVSNPPDLKILEPYAVELTEQMRQADCLHFSEYLNRFRYGINHNKELQSYLTNAPAITLVDDHKEFCRLYLTSEDNKHILAYRNSVIDKYNETINPGNKFNIGDIVILDKPIRGIANNQDKVKIADIDEDEHKYILEIVTNIGRSAVIYQYKSSSYLSAQLQMLKDANEEPEYWYMLNNAFRLKHVYASTVHKAQGTTIGTVFIDALDIINAYEQKKSKYTNPISLDMFLRLLYVAISRTKNLCYIYTGENGKGREYGELLKDPYRTTRTHKPKQKEETELFVF